MKRTPLRRKTPLQGGGRLRRTRLSSAPSKRRRRRDRVYAVQRDLAYQRALGRCEAAVADVCTGRVEQVHHLGGRVGGDPHALDNLLAVCFRCHEWIESNRAESYRLGLLRSRHGGES